MFSIKTFRYVALAEATSFLILLVVAVTSLHSEGGVNVMGPLHGTLFLAYVVIALAVARSAGWTAQADAPRAGRRGAALRRLRRRPLAGEDGQLDDGLT